MINECFEIELLMNIRDKLSICTASCFKNKNYLPRVFLKTWLTLEIQAEQR